LLLLAVDGGRTAAVMDDDEEEALVAGLGSIRILKKFSYEPASSSLLRHTFRLDLRRECPDRSNRFNTCDRSMLYVFSRLRPQMSPEIMTNWYTTYVSWIIPKTIEVSSHKIHPHAEMKAMTK
jgi:hypothetical protein